MKEDKVLEALRYFQEHATEEQKQKAIEELEKDCQSEVEFRDYVNHLKLWIARDKDKDLNLYDGEEPKRLRDYFIPEPYGRSNQYSIDKHLFPEVTWENSPQQVELKLIEE